MSLSLCRRRALQDIRAGRVVVTAVDAKTSSKATYLAGDSLTQRDVGNLVKRMLARVPGRDCMHTYLPGVYYGSLAHSSPCRPTVIQVTDPSAELFCASRQRRLRLGKQTTTRRCQARGTPSREKASDGITLMAMAGDRKTERHPQRANYEHLPSRMGGRSLRAQYIFRI